MTLQLIVRHPHHADAVGAGVAYAQASGAEVEPVIATLQAMIGDAPACKVGVACYGRRVVGVAAIGPTSRYGMDEGVRGAGNARIVPPARADELRYFSLLPQYDSPELAQRLLNFVLDSAHPAQVWLPQGVDRQFWRQQGFTLDAARTDSHFRMVR